MHGDTAATDRQLAEARAAFDRSDVAGAETLARTVLTGAPAREDAAMLLARVLQSQGRLRAAAEVLLDVCAANAFEPALSLRAATFARQCDRHTVAARICAGAIARGTVSPEFLVLAGNVAREAGDFETARARYLVALDAGVDLEQQHVLGALANTRRYDNPADPDIARFARHFADPQHSPRSRASAGFALAKAQGDLAKYAAASATVRQANGLVHATWPWSAGAWRSFVAARRSESVGASGATASHDFVPVFIVGTPRTGTTLTATLLARVSGARDRGELRALRFIADQLIRGGHLGNRSALAEAAELYRKLAVQDDAPVTWYVDQDPLNFRYLHVAAAMFPQARIIHLRRDRRDTTLSLWSQDFAHPDLAFAYDFDDIAAFMAGHDVLMAHWKEALPVPIHELDYEALVGDPEDTLATLCGFIGARFHAAGVARDDAAPVQSASVWQARQPVYKTSVGRWRRYAAHVPELARFAQYR